MKYRTKTDLVALILDVANDSEGVTRTKIMYKVFLSYTKAKEYLAVLVQNDLIRYDQNNQTYKTTERGLRFMNAYKQMGELIASPSKTADRYLTGYQEAV
jgi:predicted transcriptional regulator